MLELFFRVVKFVYVFLKYTGILSWEKIDPRNPKFSFKSLIVLVVVVVITSLALSLSFRSLTMAKEIKTYRSEIAALKAELNVSQVKEQAALMLCGDRCKPLSPPVKK